MIRWLLPAALSLFLLTATASATDIQLGKRAAVSYPDTWIVQQAARDVIELDRLDPKSKALLAAMSVRVEHRRDHSEALKRLATIEAEHDARVTYLLIGGWPAVERRATVQFPRPGEGGDPIKGPQRMTIRVTTAIAVDDALIRLDTLLQPDTPPAIAGEAQAIGKSVKPAAVGSDSKSGEELRQLQTGALRPQPPRPASHSGRHEPNRTKPGAGGVHGGGEIEVTASTNAQNILVDASTVLSFSIDGGASFSLSTVHGIPAGIDGDGTVAWGQSGNYYFGMLMSNQTGIVAFRSTDQGATFNKLGRAVDRTGTSHAVDQPHLAADRWNLSASGDDQVYVSFDETPNWNGRVACSSDSGATWGAPVDASGGGDGSYARVMVGQDGFVYVVSRNGSNVAIDKYSNCDSGLVEQPGFPASVTISDVVCPVPGLDRCNDGNTLSSPTVAIDDTNPAHVYLVYANHNGAHNEDIVVQDSIDGGENFGTAVAINTATTARRFMPWASAYGGAAYVGWYDRRDATGANNSLTRYYAGSATTGGGVLQAGTEYDISGADDDQCATGFPCGVRSPHDATSCVPAKSAAAGNGCPEYGDYNGSIAAGGVLINAWASGTAPAGVTPPAHANVHAYENIMALTSDIFVRDWTTDATHHDTGVEPSIGPDFVVSSDVWNQLTSSPDTPVNDWVLGSDAQLGADNFAFTRVSRRAPAVQTAADLDVKAHFMFADFGMGSSFVAAGSDADPTITMSAADNTKFLDTGYRWRPLATASTHVCLAVEISTPDDPGLSTLEGTSPGAASDSIIRNDNNKAQRNLSTFAGTGRPGPISHAIVHNDKLRKLTIPIVYRVPKDLVGRIADAKVGVAGGTMQPLRERGELLLKDMEPGENRWILLSFGKFQTRPGELLPITFTEMNHGRPVNGFAFAAHQAPLEEVAAGNLRELAMILGRLAASGDAHAREEAAQASALVAKQSRVDVKTYRDFVKEHSTFLDRIIDARAWDGKDRFGLLPAREELRRSLNGNDDAAIADAHRGVIDRLDAEVTAAQKAAGDPADVLQNVKWQRFLLSDSKDPVAQSLVARSTAFIEAYQRRKIGRDEFPRFLDANLDSLTAVTKTLAPGNGKLSSHVAHLRDARASGNLGAMQKAHREVLIELAAALKHR